MRTIPSRCAVLSSGHGGTSAPSRSEKARFGGPFVHHVRVRRGYVKMMIRMMMSSSVPMPMYMRSPCAGVRPENYPRGRFDIRVVARSVVGDVAVVGRQRTALVGPQLDPAGHRVRV